MISYSSSVESIYTDGSGRLRHAEDHLWVELQRLRELLGVLGTADALQ